MSINRHEPDSREAGVAVLTRRSPLAALRLPTLLFAAATLAGLAACGGDPGSGITDPDAIDAPNPDAGDIDDSLRAYGELCDNGAQCQSGFCISVNRDPANAFCSATCNVQDECPDREEADAGSACLFLTDATNQFVRACVPDDLCIDRDGDGYGAGPGCLGPDCDDNNPAIRPGAPEICDGVDNNCNGIVDESPVGAGEDCVTGLPGECSTGRQSCILGNLECLPLIFPGDLQEICDGIDNDCDGRIDEGPDGVDTNFVRGIGVACAEEGSFCADGVTVCDSATGTISCELLGEGNVSPEVCDYLDNDCNGLVDDGIDGLGIPCDGGVGICRAFGITVCVPNDPLAAPICSVPPDGNLDNRFEQETCNYNDDDCDGIADNPFVNAQGIYNTPQHCGGCGVSCAALWQPNPEAFGVVPACTITAGVASCSFTCMPGFVNVDGIAENGCEFQPDTGAIYVRTADRGGVNNASCGAYNAPCATITYGIQRAQTASRPRVRVAEGSYPEGVTLVNGISVLGGHSARNWVRNAAVNTTTISGGITVANDVYTVYANNITSATELSGFTIDAPNAGAGGNSIGVYVRNSTNALTIRDNNIFAGRGGAGATGAAGSNGSAGANGAGGLDRVNFAIFGDPGDNNYDADDACSDAQQANGYLLDGGAGGATSCGGTSTSGGRGGRSRCPGTSSNTDNITGAAGSGPGTPGTGGLSAQNTRPSPNPVAGIHACQSGNVPGDPTAGGNGSVGTDGAAGPGASNATGLVDGGSGMWRGTGGGSGGTGSHGAGGGGGGTSEGIYANEWRYDGLPNGTGSNARPRFHYGPTGGGGGAGGCRGNGASGGTAGGGSFAIFLFYSSAPASLPVIQDNLLARNQGGRGGNGGLGGVGGDGGEGGEGGAQIAENNSWTRCGRNASRGGNGGRGGHGGGGGGGAGGVSYDIFITGAGGASQSYASQNTFNLPNGTATGGQGGAGGGAIANPGTPGVTGASGNVRVN